MISPQEAARLDAVARQPVETLMDRAGYAVARQAVRMGIGAGDRVVVLAGPGNNGGDGYVAAYYLARRGADVRVEQVAPPKSDACRWAAARAAAVGVRSRPIGRVIRCDMLIDAVFGGGFRRGVPEELRPWMETDSPVLAVDIPTGVDPGDGSVEDFAFTAVATVTFHALKTGHLLGEGPDRCGEVVVADIGLEGGVPALLVVEEGDARRPSRRRTAHKWSAGSVLVVGGAVGMVGAAVMAARSALRFGAGAVGLAVPDDTQPIAAALAHEVLTYRLDQIDQVVDRFGVLAVGPGLGRQPELVRRLLAAHRGAVVLDADGINSIDVAGLRSRDGPTVLTPHGGEFRRLTGRVAGPGQAAELARETGCVVLLKGNPTFVTDGSTPLVVTSNGPELATIGTGDVLTGMVAASISRGLDPKMAAASAAYWHGVAGASLRRRGTVTADRLVEEVAGFAWEDG
ncbi:MAG: bifunctional NAD(P)H-hydrate repair enzyme [Acidimicrobiia bacterium]|nr:MAG: bifunctional NAD(P)H-hydrate repair enzyme [Acidimicrobiia bacterium]